MYGRGTLAQTGAGLAVGGTVFMWSWVAALVLVLIVGGALAYRWGTRGKRYQV